ncbi:MAG: bifunctional aspartate kinase/diaminopimelate decarboxylase [Myxococcota bacterium]|nr:bifunctional aspartate kinase/diaminopimelate decarboxylase [Myxococcota bacterium]
MTASWVVLKFGGSSVAKAEGWRCIAEQARAVVAGGDSALLVCSALGGISDLLQTLPKAALAGTADGLLATLRERHEALANELNIDLPLELVEELEQARRLVIGASLIGEAPARMRAQLLAAGELMATHLGAAFLKSQGLELTWMDARGLLGAPRQSDREQHFLNNCWDGQGQRAAAAFEQCATSVVITQGFIGSDETGETLLFGRGGSDSSAACLAAALGAKRCEFWSDVPGLFSADPRQVPSARLLQRLDYEEAQELASMGAKVLHPGCLEPLRAAGIELHTRCTSRPRAKGTIISQSGGQTDGHVKAVCLRRGLTLVTMDSIGMWQQVGFLADVFAVFKRAGLSVDMVSTSETNVTVTLDPSGGADDPDKLSALLRDLQVFCRASVITNCASVSLVGRKIRSILHELAPALSVFEDRRVHLLCQAASDLNLSLVVDDEDAERLVKRLHSELVAARSLDPEAGETLDEAVEQRSAHAGVGRWWADQRPRLLELAARHGAVYVYHLDSVRAAAAALAELPLDRVLYAIKANDHPLVLRAVVERGLCLECVSNAEVEHALTAVPRLLPERILFTPNFAPRYEYEEALRLGVHVTVDGLFPLQAWPQAFAGAEIVLRLDPGAGRGHHRHVRTGGAKAKFGISLEQLDIAAAAVIAAGARVVGLHAHSGSGIRDPENWARVGRFLLAQAPRFIHLKFIDLGGGLGVPYRPDEDGLDLLALGDVVQTLRDQQPQLEFWIEPGRYLVANAGVLLAEVTQTKCKGEVNYAGLMTGMNSLLRPALYGSHHEIHNLTRLLELPDSIVQVVGPICETGDYLGHDRRLPSTKAGDVLLIDGAGAYGAVMSSSYNRRVPAPVVTL